MWSVYNYCACQSNKLKVEYVEGPVITYELTLVKVGAWRRSKLISPDCEESNDITSVLAE